MRKTLIPVAFVTMLQPACAQKLQVKVLDRQDHETNYTYVVPGHSFANSNANVNCSGGDNTVNCNESSTTTATSTPAHQISYNVNGATLSLQLPDGRVAVVNCDSKFAEHFAGPAGNHRSCRIPLVDELQAEFKGDKARLEWNVSIDGKKSATETYKILAVLAK